MIQFDSLKASAWTMYLILAIGVAVFGCSSAKIPPAEHPFLKYSGVSKSYVMFSFENGSSQAVSFLGTSTQFGDPTPLYSGVCTSPSGNTATAIVGPALGAPSTTTTITVPSGERARLAVPSDAFDEHKGGHCRITLTLRDGSMVESAEFPP
jgi:hypothetical protein